MIDLTGIRSTNDTSILETSITSQVKLDLGCGQSKREGFLGVDFVAAPGVDVVHDLFSFPWPFADNSVDEVHSSHFYEHVPAKLRPRFMDELWRILKLGAKAQIITPHAWSDRSVQDFTHEWPPISRHSYAYFNRNWRETNKLTHGHYEMACNFDVSIGGTFYADIQSRSIEFQAFSNEHYINSLADLYATLTKLA